MSSGALFRDCAQSNLLFFPFQVIQTPEPVAPAEQVITLEETQLAGSQVFVSFALDCKQAVFVRQSLE